MILLQKNEDEKRPIGLFGGTCNFETHASPSDAAAHRFLQNIRDAQNYEPAMEDKKELVEVIQTKSQAVFDAQKNTIIFAIDYPDLHPRIQVQAGRVGEERVMDVNWKNSKTLWMVLQDLLKSELLNFNHKEALEHWCKAWESKVKNVYFYTSKEAPRVYNNHKVREVMAEEAVVVVVDVDQLHNNSQTCQSGTMRSELSETY